MFNYTELEVTPQNVFVFGCGGTGSRVVPPLLQLIKGQSNWLLNPNIYLIDGDEVETKNCSRQNFIEMDVGKNKAEVLASRYSMAFGINASYYPQFFDVDRKDLLNEPYYGRQKWGNLSAREEVDRSRSGRHKEARQLDLFKMTKYLLGTSEDDMVFSALDQARSFHQNPSSSNRQEASGIRAKSICYDPCVVILCVDSAEARRNILKAMTALEPNRKVFVIDAGNEDIFGQVKFYRLDHRMTFRDKEFQKLAYDKILNGGMNVELAESIAALTGADGGPNENLKDAFRTMLMRKYQDHNNGLTRDQLHWSGELEDKLSQIDMDKYKEIRATRRGSRGAFLIENNLPEVSSVGVPIPIMPCPDLFYDTLQDGEGTGSCADLDQTLAINNLMSASILNIMNNLVYGIPFDFHTIRISLNGGYTAEKMTPYWLKQIVMGHDEAFSSYLTRKAYEHILLPAAFDKEEGEAFLSNIITNCFAYRFGQGAAGYNEGNTWNQVKNKILKEVTHEKLTPVMEAVDLIIPLPVANGEKAKEGREAVTAHLKGLSVEQVNLVIDIMGFLEVAFGRTELGYSGSNVGDTYGMNVEGLTLAGLLFGETEFQISVTQTPTMLSEMEGRFTLFLTEYLAEAYVKDEIPEGSFRFEAEEAPEPSPPDDGLDTTCIAA